MKTAPLIYTLLFISASLGAADAQQRAANPKRATHSSGPQGALPSAEARAARTSAREQALAELDDPDPLARAGAFEDILKSGDALLIQFAQRKVLTSTDDNLRSMLIRSRLLEPKRIFTMELLACGDRESHKTNFCGQALGAVTRFPVGFQPAQGSDRFLTYSTPRPGENVVVRSGTVSGASVLFQLNLQASTFYLHDCTAALKLAQTGLMEGQLECGNLAFNVQMKLI